MPDLLLFPRAVLELNNSNTTLSEGFRLEGRGSTLNVVGGSLTTTGTGEYGRILVDTSLITSSANVTSQIKNYGQWDVYGNTTYNGHLDGNGNVTIHNGGTLNLEYAGPNYIDTSFSGAGGVVIRNGEFAFAGSNSFSGGLFLESGILKIYGGGNTGALNNSIHFNGGKLSVLQDAILATANWHANSDSEFSVEPNTQARVTGNISGNAQLRKTGAGTLILEGNNSNYNGEILVSEGALFAGVNDSLGDQTRVVLANSGTSFMLNGDENWGSLSGSGFIVINNHDATVLESGVAVINGRMNGTGSFNMAGIGEVVLDSSLGGFSTGTLRATNGKMVLKNFSAQQFEGLVATSGTGVIEFNHNNVSYDQVFEGTINNNGTLLKTGAGTVVLADGSGASTGVVEVQGGLLAANRIHGNTLRLAGGSFQANGNLSIPTLDMASSGTIDTQGFTAYVDDGLTGNGTLNKTGSGGLTVFSHADNSGYSGSLRVMEGSLKTETDLANSDITVQSGAVVDVGTNNTVHFKSLNGNGNLQLHDLSTQGVFRSARIGSGNSDMVFNGDVLGVGTLYKTGSGSLTLGGTVAGSSLVVEQGGLIASSSNSLGADNRFHDNTSARFDASFTSSTTLDFAGATVFDTNGNNVEFSGAVRGNGSMQKTGAGDLTFSGDAYGLAGNLNVESGSLIMEVSALNPGSSISVGPSGTLRLDRGLIYAGVLSGTGRLEVMQGSGDVRLLSPTDFSGDILVGNGRMLTFSGTGNADLRINGSGTVTVGATTVLDELNGSGQILVNRNLWIGADDSDSAFAGDFSGLYRMNKTGTGTFNFNGDATSLSGQFRVYDGVLAGQGRFNDLQVFSTSTLAPGNSAGSNLADSLYLASASTLEIELGGLVAGDEYDQLLINGNATMLGSLTVSLIDGFTLARNQEFLIADVGGVLSGQFTGLGEGDLVGNFGGVDLFISYGAGNGNDISLFTSSVPEPSPLMLLAAFVTCGLARRRKRN